MPSEKLGTEKVKSTSVLINLFKSIYAIRYLIFKIKIDVSCVTII